MRSPPRSANSRAACPLGRIEMQDGRGIRHPLLSGDPSVARSRHRRLLWIRRLLRLECAGVERENPDQDDSKQIDAVGLGSRGRPACDLPEAGGQAGFVAHSVFCAKQPGQGSSNRSALPQADLRSGCTRNSAANAERLSADDTIRTRAPMISMRRLKASGASACAMRAGAPMIPSR